MSLISHENKLAVDNSTITNIGTTTDLTSIQKIYNRNLSDKYRFIAISATNIDINISFSAPLASINTIALLGINFTINSVTIDGVLKTYSNIKTINNDTSNVFLVLDELTPVATDIVINCSVQTGTRYIGSIFIAKSVDIKIAPPVNILTLDTSVTDTSNGGQKYSKEGITYNELKFGTIPLIYDDAISPTVVNSMINIINKHGTHSPFVFISELKNNKAFYVTQKKPATYKEVIAKDDSGDWLYEFSFNLEEEL